MIDVFVDEAYREMQNYNCIVFSSGQIRSSGKSVLRVVHPSLVMICSTIDTRTAATLWRDITWRQLCCCSFTTK